jgi:hypothetical protein
MGKIEALADSVDVVIEKPRTTRRMTHRSIAGEIGDTAMQYFKVNALSIIVFASMNVTPLP